MFCSTEYWLQELNRRGRLNQEDDEWRRYSVTQLKGDFIILRYWTYVIAGFHLLLIITGVRLENMLWVLKSPCSFFVHPYLILIRTPLHLDLNCVDSQRDVYVSMVAFPQRRVSIGGNVSSPVSTIQTDFLFISPFSVVVFPFGRRFHVSCWIMAIFGSGIQGNLGSQATKNGFFWMRF